MLFSNYQGNEIATLISSVVGYWKFISIMALRLILIWIYELQHTVIPLQHLVSFGLNLVSRSFEFQVSLFSYFIFFLWKLLGWLICSLFFPWKLIFSFIYDVLQADIFAKKLGYNSTLRAALVKLQVIYCWFSSRLRSFRNCF